MSSSYRDQLIKFTIYSIINQIKIVLGESGRLKRKQTYPADFLLQQFQSEQKTNQVFDANA